MAQIKIYEYCDTGSIVHKLNPVVKITWLAIVSSLGLLSANFRFVLFLFVLSVVIQILSKIPFKALLPYLVYFMFFAVISVVLIFVAGQDVYVGVMFLLKITLAMIVAVQFILTTTKKELLFALLKIKIPSSFAFVLAIAFRFFSVILKEIKDVVNIQRTRAHKFVFNIFSPIKSAQSFIPIIIPLFVVLFGRSFELSLAAEARGFNPQVYAKQKLVFRFFDFWAGAVLCAVILLYFL